MDLHRPLKNYKCGQGKGAHEIPRVLVGEGTQWGAQKSRQAHGKEEGVQSRSGGSKARMSDETGMFLRPM